jgi:hypothetical protein
MDTQGLHSDDVVHPIESKTETELSNFQKSLGAENKTIQRLKNQKI